MAQTEEVQVLKITAIENVKSIKELKDNITLLKKELETTSMEDDKYSETLKELMVNQNALKDAMYNTTGSLQDLTEGAKGTAMSYNGLVHQMAKLKAELRTVDISTEAGKEKFDGLAQEIKNVNDKLKELDAEQGNYTRNVGNYEGALKNWSTGMDSLDKGMKMFQGGVMGVKGAMDGLAVNPAFTLLGLLVPIVTKLGEAFKQDKDAMSSLSAVGKSFKPVMDAISGVVGKVVDILADLTAKVAGWIANNGIFQKVLNGIVGVGNAIVKFVVAPFKGVIEAIRVFKEKGVKGLREAGKAFAEEMKNGVAFKSNFEAGASIVTAISAGAKSKKGEAESTGKETGEKIGVGIMKGIQEALKREANAQKAKDELAKEMEAFYKEAMDVPLDIEEELNKQLEAINDAFVANRRKTLQEYIDDYEVAINTVGSLMTSMADILETYSDADEKNAKKAKALRIAVATIDTISGAIKAFTQAPSKIVGALEASAVIAMGTANIAKIKATQVGGTSESSITASVPTTTAPEVSTNFDSVKTLTGASSESNINKVVLVTSELEAVQQGTATKVEESTF